MKAITLTDPKEMKVDKLPDKEFKIMIVREANKMQNNIHNKMKLGREFKVRMRFIKQMVVIKE